MASESEKVYWSHEMASLLRISDSGLRKHCLALEQAGYGFMRDEQKRRAFLDNDLLVLREMRKLILEGLTIEQAAIQVAASKKEESRTLPVRVEEAGITRSQEHFLLKVREVSLQYWTSIQEEVSGVREDVQELRQQNENMQQQNLQLKAQLEELTRTTQEIAANVEKLKDQKRKRFLGLF